MLHGLRSRFCGSRLAHAAVVFRRLIVIVKVISVVITVMYRRRGSGRMGELRRKLRLGVNRLFFLTFSVLTLLPLLRSTSVYALQRRQLTPVFLLFFGNSRDKHGLFVVCIWNVVFISAVISVWHNELLSML